MLALLLALTAVAAPSTTFEFTGQPDCVQLEYEAGTTTLFHTCTHPLLVDQSVVLQSTQREPTGVLPAHTPVQLRDLSAFTLGMNGHLYRAVAVLLTEPGQSTTPAS